MAIEREHQARAISSKVTEIDQLTNLVATLNEKKAHGLEADQDREQKVQMLKNELEQQGIRFRQELELYKTKLQEQQSNRLLVESRTTEIQESLKNQIKQLQDQLSSTKHLVTLMEKQKVKDGENLESALLEIKDLREKTVSKLGNDLHSEYASRQRSSVSPISQRASKSISRTSVLRSSQNLKSDLENRRAHSPVTPRMLGPKGTHHHNKVQAHLSEHVSEFEVRVIQQEEEVCLQRASKQPFDPRTSRVQNSEGSRKEVDSKGHSALGFTKSPTSSDPDDLHYVAANIEFTEFSPSVAAAGTGREQNFTRRDDLSTSRLLQPPSSLLSLPLKEGWLVSHHRQQDAGRDLKENKENFVQNQAQGGFGSTEGQKHNQVLSRNPLRSSGANIKEGYQERYGRSTPVQPAQPLPESKMEELKKTFTNLITFYSSQTLASSSGDLARPMSKLAARRQSNHLQKLQCDLTQLWEDLQLISIKSARGEHQNVHKITEEQAFQKKYLDFIKELFTKLLGVVEVMSDSKEALRNSYFEARRELQVLTRVYKLQLKFWKSLNIDRAVLLRKTEKYIRQTKAVNVIIRHFKAYKKLKARRHLEQTHKTHYQLFQAGSGKFLLQSLMQQSEEFLWTLGQRLRPDGAVHDKHKKAAQQGLRGIKTLRDVLEG